MMLAFSSERNVSKMKYLSMESASAMPIQSSYPKITHAFYAPKMNSKTKLVFANHVPLNAGSAFLQGFASVARMGTS